MKTYMKERVRSLDLLKGIGCIGVVFIHYSFPGLFGEILHQLAEFAVPVFFMISGYFASGCSIQRLKNRLIYVFKIFILSLFLYFLIELLAQIKNGNGVNWIISQLSRTIRFFRSVNLKNYQSTFPV